MGNLSTHIDDLHSLRDNGEADDDSKVLYYDQDTGKYIPLAVEGVDDDGDVILVADEDED